MNSEFIETKKDENKGYPCLMVYNNHDNNGIYVVLFISDNTGTVVYTESKLHRIGQYHTIWAINYFKPISGEIILSN